MAGKGKIKVGLIYGGQSFEHEVSKMTAKSILDNIDREKFDVKEIYIPKDGKFDEKILDDINAAFLAVHGPNCEDGKLQQLLENRGIKYTGAGVKASRLNMDKVAQHEIFRSAGLNVTDYLIVKSTDDLAATGKKIEEKLGFPYFVKPNNGGSSVGMSRVVNINKLQEAISEALKLDNTLIIEKAVLEPTELEVAVLGNHDLTVSEPGEIIVPDDSYYSYENKYFDPYETIQVARIKPEIAGQIKEQAKIAYKATGCAGYARVDFLVDKKNKIFINEINTLPGFTKISMFPKMMAAKGISYKELITRIIELALE